MPWTWLIGLRKLGLTRLEATLVSLCVYSINSWRKFGLELEAFQYYGLFTQAHGMAIFPMAGIYLLVEEQLDLIDCRSRKHAFQKSIVKHNSNGLQQVISGHGAKVQTRRLPRTREKARDQVSNGFSLVSDWSKGCHKFSEAIRDLSVAKST